MWCCYVRCNIIIKTLQCRYSITVGVYNIYVFILYSIYCIYFILYKYICVCVYCVYIYTYKKKRMKKKTGRKKTFRKWFILLFVPGTNMERNASRKWKESRVYILYIYLYHILYIFCFTVCILYIILYIACTHRKTKNNIMIIPHDPATRGCRQIVYGKCVLK